MHPARIYTQLHATYGPQHWWPVQGAVQRGVHDATFEILVGCILTQNTAWTNVEKAIAALVRRRLLTPQATAAVRIDVLRACIRPAGYFNQKAKKLKILSRTIVDDYGGNSKKFIGAVSRDALLALWGVGPETADSMLLYAGKRPEFVVDTYTKRLCATYGVEFATYDAYKRYFTECLPADAALYNEFHALIVAWGKSQKRRGKK